MKLAQRCLQLDVGNSASKWRLLEQGQIVTRGTYLSGDEVSRAELLCCTTQLEQIWIASVAGHEAESELSRILARQWGVEPWIPRSTAQCGAVRNSYSAPARMGVDRWLAILAAWERVRGRVCIVDAGSAVTIDLVGDSGVHDGGYILPGPALMERALLQDTGRVRFAEEVDHALTPGASTAQAVRHGIALAQAGALSLAMDREGITATQLLFCGGWGEALMGLLNRGGQYLPDLVFEGLEVLAGETEWRP